MSPLVMSLSSVFISSMLSQCVCVGLFKSSCSILKCSRMSAVWAFWATYPPEQLLSIAFPLDNHRLLPSLKPAWEAPQITKQSPLTAFCAFLSTVLVREFLQNRLCSTCVFGCRVNSNRYSSYLVLLQAPRLHFKAKYLKKSWKSVFSWFEMNKMFDKHEIGILKYDNT